ncbi:MAG: hypothetical protein ACTSYB_12220 [Candidatus Helarchaeota archaeon]
MNPDGAKAPNFVMGISAMERLYADTKQPGSFRDSQVGRILEALLGGSF